MRRPVFFLILALLAAAGGCAGQRRYTCSFTGLFDTVTVVAAYAKSEDAFNRFADVIYSRMEELHRLYDIYHEYDGINNLRTVNNNAGIRPVPVDGDIIDILLLARDFYQHSGGAVNIALGPVLSIWRGHIAEGLADPEKASLPDTGRLREAALLSGINGLIIDEKNNTVYLEKPGMSLDVGAVAKAHAAGLALEAAREAGMVSGFINAGGTVAAIGKPAGRELWNVGIQDPDDPGKYADTVRFTDMTLSCSGDYQRFYTVDGKNYHHIINPASLMPAGLYRQVAVIHENAALADLLSTALFILPYEEGAALAARYGAAAMWTDSEGNALP